MSRRLRGYIPLTLIAAVSSAINWREFLRIYQLAEWWQYARLDYAWFGRYTLDSQVRFLGAFALLFVLYLAAWRHLVSKPSAGPLGLILAGQAAIGLPLLGIYPIAALDLYDYLLYGRLGVYWGANPLAQLPSQFPAEPLLAYSYWPNEPSVYGPFWQQISQALTVLVNGQLPAGLVVFKVLALLAALTTTALVWLSIRRFAPALAPAGALLYGWNPLQLFETAGNGHNDSLMVACLALAMCCLIRGPRWLALPALALGLLVKVSVAPLVPLVLVGTVLTTGQQRPRWGSLAGGLAASALLTVAFYAPFWQGRASLPFLDRGNWFTASPPTLLRELFRQWQPFEVAGRSAATLSAALFAVLMLVMLAQLARRRPASYAAFSRAIVRAGYQIFFAYLVVGCLWWQPWYLLVLLLQAALSTDRALADRVNLFCVGGLLSYPVFKYVWSVHQADWSLDYFKIMALSVVVIFTLPLLHLVVDQLKAWGPARQPEPGSVQP
jgi:hypothetical protein